MEKSSFRFKDYSSAFRPDYASMLSLVKLGIPFAVSLLAEMAMMWTDIWFVSQLGVRELASVSLAFNYFVIAFIGGLGMVVIVNPLFSEKIGSKNYPEAMRLLVGGLWIAVLAGFVVGGLVLVGPTVLLAIGQDASLVLHGKWYMYLLALGVPFALATIVMRGLYSAVHRSLLFGGIFCGGLLLNIVFDYVFIFGHFGVPELGILGAALATFCVNVILFVITFSFALWGKDFRSYRLWSYLKERPNLLSIQMIALLGFPVSISFVIEESFFMGSTFLVGYLGVEALAIHQVMVVVGLMGVAAMWGFAEGARSQLGWSVGNRDVADFIRTTVSFVVVGTLLVGVLAATIFLSTEHIARQFFNPETTDINTIRLFEETARLWSFYLVMEVPVTVSVTLMYVCGDTRSKMLMDIAIYWLLALPVVGTIVLWGDGNIYSVWFWSGNAIVLMSICTGIRSYLVVKNKLAELVSADGSREIET